MALHWRWGNSHKMRQTTFIQTPVQTSNHWAFHQSTQYDMVVKLKACGNVSFSQILMHSTSLHDTTESLWSCIFVANPHAFHQSTWYDMLVKVKACVNVSMLQISMHATSLWHYMQVKLKACVVMYLCWYTLACGPDMDPALLTFHTENCLGLSDWLKLLGWLAAQSPQSTL